MQITRVRVFQAEGRACVRLILTISKRRAD